MTLKFNDATGTHPITAIEAIYSRRSVRHFTDEIVDSELLSTLLSAAVQAPTAMHEEPCAFSVIQDQGLLHRISNEIKEAVLASRSDKNSHSQISMKFGQKKDFEVFYNASTLVLICGKFPGRFVEADCWLAAENLMLAAYSHGLGSCVIGFAIDILNTPEWKSELSIPEGVRVVAPIILGKPSELASKVDRKPPEILSWKSLSLEND